MSMQQLADRTAELGMPIPQSVLANLESGRRETVSVAEILVLAAALKVSPLELIFPVGFDRQMEVLPGRVIDPLVAMRWFTGEWTDASADKAWTMPRPPNTSAEQSSPYLVKQHDELINHLRTQEETTARAIADVSAKGADESARATASYWMSNLADFRGFIYEALRNIRAEMRNRGMLLPDLPPDISLEEEPEAASSDSGEDS
jgi:transcriptional regulator with XRE-family HTH domain